MRRLRRPWNDRRFPPLGVKDGVKGINVPLTKAEWDIQVGHDFDHHNAFLSEGGALAVVVRCFSETSQGRRDDTDFPPPLRYSVARLRLTRPPFARRNSAPHERGGWWMERPPFYPPLMRHLRRLTGSHGGTRLTPILGGRSIHQ